MSDIKKLEEIQKACIEVAMEVSRQGEGTLIVIGDQVPYESHFPNFFATGKKFSVLEDGMETVLIQLAQIDGAIIVNSKGTIVAYGARILNQKALPGKGTRHSAALGISRKDAVSVLASEEDKMVKIFKGGAEILQINPFTKGVENHVEKVVRVINRPEAALLAGSAIAAPLLGIAVLPGIIIFAGSVYVAKNVLKLADQKKNKA